MQDHKVGNFMVKGIILGLHLENGLKSLRIKLLMSWVDNQLCMLGVQGVRYAYVVNRPVHGPPTRTFDVQLSMLSVLSWVDSVDFLEF